MILMIIWADRIVIYYHLTNMIIIIDLLIMIKLMFSNVILNQVNDRISLRNVICMMSKILYIRGFFLCLKDTKNMKVIIKEIQH